MIELEKALSQVLAQPERSPRRLDAFADYLINHFANHGLTGLKGGSQGERLIKGWSKVKKWDLAYELAEKPRLLISLKSIFKNAGGSISNRIDDGVGEAAHVQQLSPEIVAGYVMLFDMQSEEGNVKRAIKLAHQIEDALRLIAIRKAPIWTQGLLEAYWLILFDSKQQEGKRLCEPEKVYQDQEIFIGKLLAELQVREPSIRAMFKKG